MRASSRAGTSGDSPVDRSETVWPGRFRTTVAGAGAAGVGTGVETGVYPRLQERRSVTRWGEAGAAVVSGH